QAGELDCESSDRAILLGMGVSPGQFRWPALKRDGGGDIHWQSLKALLPRLPPQQPQQRRLLGTPVQVGGLHQNTPHISSKQSFSDTATAKFGIREITDEKNANGYELFRINHRRILIRGGGWSPDMFLRANHERL